MFCITLTKVTAAKKTNEGSFLQTPFWAEFKSEHGWASMRFSLHAEQNDSDFEDSDFALGDTECSVLIRSFKKGFLHFSVAYIPLFPELPLKNHSAQEQSIEFASFLNDFAVALKPFLPKDTICIKIDPSVIFSTPEERDTFNRGIKLVSFADRLRIKKSKQDIQPPDSTQVLLTSTEEEILNAMKSKWRYNIHLSERKGVTIQKIMPEECSEDELNKTVRTFYDMYKITAERDGIAVHSESYYKDLLSLSAKKTASGEDSPKITMYIAHHEEDCLGAIITLFSKTESIYLYGCSTNQKRNLMPNFLLQWSAIKDAKSYGSKYYDMYGMPPTNDETHPMHGLYLFKTGFGGTNIHRPGTYDIPLKSLYKAYSAAENLRAFWHKKIKKVVRGR